MTRRATSEAAKAQRHAAILDVAADAFDRLSFEATSMDWLASRAGIAKGTLYLYFPTKEAVFLALYLRELDAWFAALNRQLAALPAETSADETGRIAGLLVDTLERCPRLPPLAGILHTGLERNIGEPEALAFRQQLAEHFAATGDRLERRLTFLAAGDGTRLLLRVHALLIGCWHVATPAAVTRRVLERTELAAQHIDFLEELEDALVLLLEGWRRGNG